MRIAIAALAALSLAGCMAAKAANSDAPVAAAKPQDALAQRPSLLAGGYLPRGTVPDSLLLNPPPPAPGSAAEARDVEAANAALALQGTARWEQAAIDADLFSPNTIGIFSCAAGFPIDPAKLPKLAALLRKAAPDLAMAVYPSKRRYQRARPFMVNKRPTCTPQDEKMLPKDGSYPSGHSAIGYGWGLILAEVVPDRAAQLAARGRAFGDSRRVCNVHWLSDVEEGRAVADAVLARLHAEASFRADIEAARAEVELQRLKNLPAPDCARENAALGNS
jgi:acid phosphatase (class A)